MSETNLEKDFNAVGDVFKCLYTNMKVFIDLLTPLCVLTVLNFFKFLTLSILQSSFPIWEDFIQRGQRFQRSLE